MLDDKPTNRQTDIRIHRRGSLDLHKKIFWLSKSFDFHCFRTVCLKDQRWPPTLNAQARDVTAPGQNSILGRRISIGFSSVKISFFGGKLWISCFFRKILYVRYVRILGFVLSVCDSQWQMRNVTKRKNRFYVLGTKWRKRKQCNNIHIHKFYGFFYK